AIRRRNVTGVQTCALPILRALHKDGSWRRLEAVGVNRLDDPAIRAIVVTYRDITERQRTERDLRETLSLLNATFESTTDGILVRSEERRVGKECRAWWRQR